MDFTNHVSMCWGTVGPREPGPPLLSSGKVIGEACASEGGRACAEAGESLAVVKDVQVVLHMKRILKF